MPDLAIIDPLSSSALTNRSSRFVYVDDSVRLFLLAAVFWGFATGLVGVMAGLLLSMPGIFRNLNEAIQSNVTFARVNSVQSSLFLFAFGGNAVFAGIYYSIQRLCKVPLWSGAIATIHFAAWQFVLVAMLFLQLAGFAPGRSLTGAPWPTDIAFALIWICFFGFNCVMTIARRRERHLYVSLWFYMAAILSVAFLQISSSLVTSFTGVQDAWIQNWYSLSLGEYLLTMPFLGFMYYFLPKAADRPLYSYKLSIVHFWSTMLLLICTSSKQLHYTPIPEWASTFGMLCGIMLWMPSWAGVVNGLSTLSGAWQKVKQDPALRFMVVGLVVYGFTSFESSILSIKSIQAMVHYSDWELAHLHSVAMGWHGFMAFGMIYWLLPRLFVTRTVGLINAHFWLALVGLLLTTFTEYCSGFIQAQKWSQLSELGRIQYSFMETLQSVASFWWIRLFGGIVYLAGMLLLVLHILQHLFAKRIRTEAKVQPALQYDDERLDWPATASALTGKPVLDIAAKLDQFAMLNWHRKLERQPLRFAVCIGSAVCFLSLIQWIPICASNLFQSPIASVQPYTPLELLGRDIYISQGCQNCHSQLIRPIVHESQRYGPISQAGEFVFDRPALWGNRRVGPDLAREGGGKQSSFWHWRHFENASTVTPGTVMPVYQKMLSEKLPISAIGKRILSESDLGTPYDLTLEEGETMDIKYQVLAQKQAESIAAEIIGQGGPVAYRGTLIKDTAVIALIAYIQRLGTDLSRPVPLVPTQETKTN